MPIFDHLTELKTYRVHLSIRGTDKRPPYVGTYKVMSDNILGVGTVAKQKLKNAKFPDVPLKEILVTKIEPL